MKIGVVTVALSHGGAERVAVTLANGFSQKGHQVILLTDLNEPIDYYPDTKVKLVGVLKDRKQGVKRWINAISAIRKTSKQERPDIIIGIMGLCTLATYIACLGLKIPIVMTEHWSFETPKSAPMSFPSKIFKFWINRLYKHVTVLTEADKEVIGNRLKNVTVMPNPLLLEPVCIIPAKEDVILAAGRLDAWHYKGFDVLLQAWKSLSSTLPRREGDSWWLKIAGTGKRESLEYLMGLIPDGGWEPQNSRWKSEKYHIEFLGFRKDLEELYKSSEIFVLSSRYEGFGLVLIEAMSQGCAPVACDYKGRQREIISPFSILPRREEESLTPALPRREGDILLCENGILCEPDNVEALAQALKEMIDDVEYRHQVQLNAVERSKFYDMEQTMCRWEMYITNIVKDNEK